MVIYWPALVDFQYLDHSGIQMDQNDVTVKCDIAVNLLYQKVNSGFVHLLLLDVTGQVREIRAVWRVVAL